MKTFKFIPLSSIIFTVTLLNCSVVFADEITVDKKPLSIRTIMQDLGFQMKQITHGISMEDWPLVEKSALLIAEHPKPPIMDRMRIITFLGTDMPNFKAHDKKTHSTAKALSKAAETGDGKTVISEFATLQNSCLACHQQYRSLLKEHFYSKR